MGGDERRGDSGEDRISCLPDELLHDILARLRSVSAAARTSVLSRRWRHLWADMPDLLFIADHDAPPPTASFLDTVDAALSAHAAPTLERLAIVLAAGSEGDAITSGRAAPWLRLAAQRVAGKLVLFVPMLLSFHLPVVVQELELPACGLAKTIMLRLPAAWRLRPEPAGVFTALTALTIQLCRMEGSELTALVSTRCPCLKDLKLCLSLVDVSDVSIRSDTLSSLSFSIWNSSLIEVIAPKLEKLRVSYASKARLSVPKLSELVWVGDYANDSHQFVNVSRSLQLLILTPGERSTVVPMSLLHKFDELGELHLIIDIPGGAAGYESFLNATSKLPKCETLNICLHPEGGHGLAPSIFHLLRNCSAKKFCVVLPSLHNDSQEYSCPQSCSCRLAESCRVDDNALSSVEEVKISSCTSSHEELEFVELLSKGNATNLKHLVINYDESKFQAPLESKEICKKMASMYGPNVEVKFYVVGQSRRVCFD